MRFKRVTPSYPHGYYVCACGEKLVSCMKLLSRGLILKENDCNECDYRFKCYTGGYD